MVRTRFAAIVVSIYWHTVYSLIFSVSRTVIILNTFHLDLEFVQSSVYFLMNVFSVIKKYNSSIRRSLGSDLFGDFLKFKLLFNIVLD